MHKFHQLDGHHYLFLVVDQRVDLHTQIPYQILHRFTILDIICNYIFLQLYHVLMGGSLASEIMNFAPVIILWENICLIKLVRMDTLIHQNTRHVYLAILDALLVIFMQQTANHVLIMLIS